MKNDLTHYFGLNTYCELLDRYHIVSIHRVTNAPSSIAALASALMHQQPSLFWSTLEITQESTAFDDRTQVSDPHALEFDNGHQMFHFVCLSNVFGERIFEQNALFNHIELDTHSVTHHPALASVILNKLKYFALCEDIEQSE